MSSTLFDSEVSSPYDLTQPNLQFIDQLLFENTDYNAGHYEQPLDLCLTPVTNNPNSPERSNDAKPTESSSNPDVDSSFENNHQDKSANSSKMRQRKHRNKEQILLREARELYNSNGLQLSKIKIWELLIREVKRWRSLNTGTSF